MVIAGLWFIGWAREGIPAWFDRRAFLAAQAEAIAYPTTPLQALLHSDSPAAPSAMDAFYRKYASLWRKTQSVYLSNLPGQTIFVHDRTSKDGQRRLVSVHTELGAVRPDGHCELSLCAVAYVLHDQGWWWLLPDATERDAPVTMLATTLNVVLKPGERCVVYGATADPLDASRVIVPLTIDNVPVPVDFHLIDVKPVNGHPTAAMTFAGAPILNDRSWGGSLPFHE